jgi:hypothetical protein
MGEENGIEKVTTLLNTGTQLCRTIKNCTINKKKYFIDSR